MELIHKGEKVGSSEAALLAKLGIRPFSYGLVVVNIYDNGSTFAPAVLDLTEDDLLDKFLSGVATVAALSLGIGYPTLAAAPHAFVNAYKNLLAIAVETEYSFPLAEKTKEYLKVSFVKIMYCWHAILKMSADEMNTNMFWQDVLEGQTCWSYGYSCFSYFCMFNDIISLLMCSFTVGWESELFNYLVFLFSAYFCLNQLNW